MCLLLFYRPRFVPRCPVQFVHSLSGSYAVLGLEPGAGLEQVREAYLDKAKVYHPDGQKSTGDTEKFVQLQQAFTIVQQHIQSQAAGKEEEINKEVSKTEIKHTIAQHRRYLTYEGIGFGSPSKREQQYRQYQMKHATESMYEHWLQKYGNQENAVIAKDKTEARKIKISNLIERVVDDLIRESIQRGDFDNLSGQGKPLNHCDYNPFIDLTTHNINKILVNNGFKPEWIILSKEIRDGMAVARERLAISREILGSPPYSQQDSARWKFNTKIFRESVEEINKTISKYNLIVPFMEKQMAHYNVDTNIQKIINNHKQFLSLDSKCLSQLKMFEATRKGEDMKIGWNEVWSNIKQVFTYR